MRCAWLVVPIVLALTSCGADTAPKPAAKTGRSVDGVVLVTVDGLVPERMGAFGGSDPTPKLDALAARGAAWKDVWTVVPMSRPSVASYLTGLAPDRHLVTDDVQTALAETTPTLASVLRSSGFHTAAFPASTLLGTASGLLRGFQTVDEPPTPPFGPSRRHPFAVPARAKTDNFATWLSGVPKGEPYFAWIHLCEPWRAQIDGAQGNAASATSAVDDAVGAVLDAIRAHGDEARSVVVVGGTFGDVSGGAGRIPGPGMALDEPALRVPLVAAFPTGKLTEAASPRSTLDVPVTLAAMAGAVLPSAEGTDLRSASAQRTLWSWSWAPLQQMGWTALRAVRRGQDKLIEDGGVVTTATVAGAGETPGPIAAGDALRAALAQRPMPLPPRIPLRDAAPALEAVGVKIAAVPESGREFRDVAKRGEAASRVEEARTAHEHLRARKVEVIYAKALEADPDNLAALVERGLLLNRILEPKAIEPLRRAVELYPWDPEAVHWFGHVVAQGTMERSAALWTLAVKALPGDPDMLYDLACARSVQGDAKGAAALLRDAIRAGFANWDVIQADGDLKNLRASDEFAKVMREFGR